MQKKKTAKPAAKARLKEALIKAGKSQANKRR